MTLKQNIYVFGSIPYVCVCVCGSSLCLCSDNLKSKTRYELWWGLEVDGLSFDYYYHEVNIRINIQK